jgi:hypothetical protein
MQEVQTELYWLSLKMTGMLYKIYIWSLESIWNIIQCSECLIKYKIIFFWFRTAWYLYCY